MTARPKRVLEDLVADQEADWRVLAACAGADPAIFFPVGDADPGKIEAAKRICRTCPVADECLAYAIGTNQTEGIWGGLSPGERRRLRRRWLEQARRAS